MSATVCQRRPRTGDVLGIRCECGHTNLVHDDGGCVMCALRVLAPTADPKPPTLREQVAAAWCAEWYGETSESAKNPAPDQLDAADAVLAVVADWLAAQPHAATHGLAYVEQREHDVLLILAGGAS